MIILEQVRHLLSGSLSPAEYNKLPEAIISVGEECVREIKEHNKEISYSSFIFRVKKYLHERYDSCNL